jgi:hypothetical protein
LKGFNLHLAEVAVDHYALMDLHLDQAHHHQSHQVQQNLWDYQAAFSH